MLLRWRRLPVILRAVIVGGVVSLAGTTPWAFLVGANLKFFPSVPWAVPPTVLYLWIFWRYVRGEGWPKSTAEARRSNARANALSGEVWGAALLAGVLGLAGVVLLQKVMNRMVLLPQEDVSDISRIPFITVVVLLLTSAAVAGIVEEVSFRGYLQRPIERRHGPAVAILVTGALFGFAHFTHPEVSLILMPYYVAVAAVYGGLAYLTDSILPSLVLHAGGNVLGYMDLITHGRSEWQASSSPQPLIWQTGADATFWFSCGALVVVAALAFSAYRALARVVGRTRERGAP